jgi:glucokinase
MVEGFPRLLGDIGGTNARWAWQAAPGEPLQHYREYPCAQFESVQAVMERYLTDHNLPPPAEAAFGIATPVTGDVVQMTNHTWTFSVQELKHALHLNRCLVLNDFAAIAAALPALGSDDVRRIGGATAVVAAPMAVLGPGTGLGVASLVFAQNGRPVVVDGEGGHVSLAATNARESAVLEWLQKRFGHASAERAISGPGLVSLYRAICAVDGKPALDLKPAQVSAHALPDDGTDRHEACKEALYLFGAFLGSVAGDLALTVGARGGVYIGGGIVPRLGSAFDALPFRERFEAKGRFRSYLERIPTFVITAPAPALYGAANALDALNAAS